MVPTLGRSGLLERCLERLREDGGSALEIVLVHQGEQAACSEARMADTVIQTESNRGFTGGCNAGIARASGELVALVNDDVLIEPGWFASLEAGLERHPEVAGVQGVNLMLDQPEVVDGCGIAWNAFWRPVQIGRGRRLPLPDNADRELFGVSCTACLFRRQALEEASLAHGQVFDERLVSYFEDVELAGRLRRLGMAGILVPGARALHAGSATARQFPGEHQRLLTANRYLVLRRLSGRRFALRASRLLFRDAVELVAAVARRNGRTAAAILAGLTRAWHLLAGFSGEPALPESAIAPFRVRRAISW